MFGLSFVAVGYFLCRIVLDNIGFGILDKYFVLYIDYFVLDVILFNGRVNCVADDCGVG